MTNVSLLSDLPENIEYLLTNKKVTYRGCGLNSNNVRITVNGKEYTISNELFLSLGGITTIRFKAPARKHN